MGGRYDDDYLKDKVIEITKENGERIETLLGLQVVKNVFTNHIDIIPILDKDEDVYEVVTLFFNPNEHPFKVYHDIRSGIQHKVGKVGYNRLVSTQWIPIGKVIKPGDVRDGDLIKWFIDTSYKKPQQIEANINTPLMF